MPLHTPQRVIFMHLWQRAIVFPSKSQNNLSTILRRLPTSETSTRIFSSRPIDPLSKDFMVVRKRRPLGFHKGRRAVSILPCVRRFSSKGSDFSVWETMSIIYNSQMVSQLTLCLKPHFKLPAEIVPSLSNFTPNAKWLFKGNGDCRLLSAGIKKRNLLE